MRTPSHSGCSAILRLSANRARGAAGSIKSRTPAEMLGWGPRPGVERSETPGIGD